MVVSFDSNGRCLDLLEKKRTIGNIENEFDPRIQGFEQFGDKNETRFGRFAIIGVELLDYCHGKTKNGGHQQSNQDYQRN